MRGMRQNPSDSMRTRGTPNWSNRKPFVWNSMSSALKIMGEAYRMFFCRSVRWPTNGFCGRVYCVC
jgi:hypothetical protein